jgi:hypothetical protein
LGAAIIATATCNDSGVLDKKVLENKSRQVIEKLGGKLEASSWTSRQMTVHFTTP